MTRPISRIRWLLVTAVAAAVVGLGAAAGWEAVARRAIATATRTSRGPGGWYKRPPRTPAPP